MKIAQEYSKTQPVSYLPYTKLLALLQVPEADRDEFIQETHLVDGQEKTVSEMSKRELEQAIKERDEAQRNERLMREQCDKAEKAAVEAREDKKKEYDNYMNALVKAEKAEETLDILRSNHQFDLQRIGELEKQVRELESRPIDVAVREPSENEREILRNEGFENARAVYDVQLANARRQLEEAKSQARNDMGLEPDEIVAAAASFRVSLNAALNNFLLIVRISPSGAIEKPVRECILNLRDMIDNLEDSAAVTCNSALMDEDIELPPEDGMEER